METTNLETTLNSQLKNQVEIHNQNVKHIKYKMLAKLFAYITFGFIVNIWHIHTTSAFHINKGEMDYSYTYSEIYKNAMKGTSYSNFFVYLLLVIFTLTTISFAVLSFDALKKLK